MPDPLQPTPIPPNPTPQPSPEPKADAPSSLLGDLLDPAKAQQPTPDPAKPGDKPEPPPPAAAPGAPDAYTDFTLPEGFSLAGETLTEATALFKELGLPQDRAQKLVDFHTKQIAAAVGDQAKFWQDTQDTWVDELRSDPNLGKGIENGTVGASISKMLASGLPAPLSAAFREAMNFTGAGNNPAIVRGLYALSQKFVEPGHVQGNAPATRQARPSAADSLYGPPQSKG